MRGDNLSVFEEMLFHEKMANTAGVNAEISKAENIFHSSKVNEMANVIQTRWNIYFTAEKDQLPVAAHYLQLYRGAKDSKLKSRVRNYLSVLSVYLHDKERFTRGQYKAYGAKIKELQAEYAKDRKNKKLRSELIKLGKAQAELGRELKTIDKYKSAFKETIDCAYII